MQRLGRISSDQRGFSQAVGIVTVLAVGFAALSVFYLMARQDAYADNGSMIKLTQKKAANQNANTNTSAQPN